MIIIIIGHFIVAILVVSVSGIPAHAHGLGPETSAALRIPSPMAPIHVTVPILRDIIRMQKRHIPRLPRTIPWGWVGQARRMTIYVVQRLASLAVGGFVHPSDCAS